MKFQPAGLKIKDCFSKKDAIFEKDKNNFLNLKIELAIQIFVNFRGPYVNKWISNHSSIWINGFMGKNLVSVQLPQ